MKQILYICKHCGNMVAMIRDKGVPSLRCGEKMHEIHPGTTEASGEKYIPVYEMDGNAVHVTVGSAVHPITGEHYYRMDLHGDRAWHSVCPSGPG